MSAAMRRAVSRPLLIDIIVISAALSVWHALLSTFVGRGYFESISPTMWQSVQLAKLGAEEWIEANVPLWNPYVFGGFPFHASGVGGVFYPANLLFTLDDLDLALRVDLAVHMLIGALGAYALTREITASRIAALLVGVAAVCAVPAAGFFVDQPLSTLHAFAFLPWLVLCARRAMVTGRPIWGLLAALTVAAQTFTGAVQFATISIVMAALFVLFDALRRYFGDWEALATVLRKTLVGLIGLGIGVALAGAQVVPSIELLASASDRASTPAETETFEYIHSVVVATPIPFEFEGDVPSIQFGGLFLLLLASFGFVRSRSREKWVLLSVVVAAYLFVSGGMTWLYARMFTLPFFDPSTAAGEVAVATSLFFLLLAGSGVAVVIKPSESLAAQARLIWPLSAALAGAIALCLWYAGDAPDGSMWTALGLLVLGVGATLMRKYHAALAGAWVAACVMFDLSAGVADATVEPAPPAAFDLYAPGGRFEQIAREFKGYGRMVLVPGVRETEQGRLYAGIMNAERTLPLFSEHDAMFLGDAWTAPVELPRLVWAFEDEEIPGQPTDAQTVQRSIDLLCALNVEYIISPAPGPLIFNRICEVGDTLIAKYEIPHGVIYKNVGAGPVAYILHDAAVLKTGETFAGRAADPEFDWTRTVLVDEPVDASDLGQPSESEGVRVARYTPHEVELELTVGSPGILVLTDSFYPGWRATFADGSTREVIRVNGFMRGVKVRPGDSGVVFSYLPDSFETGWKLSLGAAILWVLTALILGASWIVRRAQPSPEPRIAE